MKPSTTSPPYLAGQIATPEQIKEWVETFHRQGFLFLQNVLPPEWCAELRQDLDWALEHNPTGLNAHNAKLILAHRLFESSAANVRLFDVEPIVSLAEALIAPNCHVIHNNSFKTPTTYGIDTWHQDDAPHYLVTEGEPPKNVLLFTTIVGPASATYRDPVTGTDLSNQANWRVDVHPRPEGTRAPSYRDFTLFLQDEDPVIGTHIMPYRQQVAGVVGLNYGVCIGAIE